MLNLSKKILVAIDGSPQSDKAAEEAVRLAAVGAGASRHRLYAVMVLPTLAKSPFLPNTPMSERPDWEEKRQRAFYVVEKAAGEAAVQIENIIVYGDPVEEILRQARGLGCDLIVIGSSGKGVVKRTLEGSVSTKVTLKAECSVLLIR
jgi:nucleotide-binding universal stress UspA family protein